MRPQGHTVSYVNTDQSTEGPGHYQRDLVDVGNTPA